MVDPVTKVATPIVRILVCYAWARGPRTRALAAADDTRWCALRDILRASVRPSARAKQSPFQVRVDRLRATHGSNVLSTISRRLSKAHIIIADVSDRRPRQCNPNVLLELGIALGNGFGERGRLFVFKPRSTPLPSDLNGLLITEYSRVRGSLKLSDDRGFKAKLRAAVRKVADEAGDR